MAAKYTEAQIKLFGEWLAGRLDEVDQRLLQAMSDTVGLSNWTTFEQPMKKHCSRCARDNEGRFGLKNAKQYAAVGEVLCDLVKKGEITFPGVNFTKGIEKSRVPLNA